MKTNIELFIEEKGKVSISELKKEFTPEEINNCLSKLVLSNGWRVEYSKGRLYILSECAKDKEKKKTTTTHKDGISEIIIPKCIPVNNDWVVTSINSDKVLFFDSKYSRDSIRTSFSKSEKVKRDFVRASRYKKIEVIRTMANFR